MLESFTVLDHVCIEAQLFISDMEGRLTKSSALTSMTYDKSLRRGETYHCSGILSIEFNQFTNIYNSEFKIEGCKLYE